MGKKRTDADRRARQCERLARLLHILRCILGPGRWNARQLATELECSPRTIHRLLQTLSVANVPWYFDPAMECYRVRPGYAFPGLTVIPAEDITRQAVRQELSTLLKQSLGEAERMVAALHALLIKLDNPVLASLEAHGDKTGRSGGIPAGQSGF